MWMPLATQCSERVFSMTLLCQTAGVLMKPVRLDIVRFLPPERRIRIGHDFDPWLFDHRSGCLVLGSE